MKTLALLMILALSVGGVIVLSADVVVSQGPPPPPPPPPPPVYDSSKGNLLKRSSEETCHSCHKTEKNTDPNDPAYRNAIKTHNSANTGSSKWSVNGGWGTPDGRYGEFVCTTCHTSHNTKNIYLIREKITTPDGMDWGTSGSADLNIDFRSFSGVVGVTPGLMGDDANDHSVSTRVCEACHSQNKYHNSDTAITADRGHHNAENCMNCHDHKGAFKPGCSSCHGCPPALDTAAQSGLVFSPSPTGSATGARHVRHAAGGNNYSFPCDWCHFNGMPVTATVGNNKIQIGFNLFGGVYPGAGTTYKGQTLNTPYSYEFTNGTTLGTTALQCENIYCHGSTMSVLSDMNGGTNITPKWNDPATGTCGTCHGATAANPPLRGGHAKHTGNSSSMLSPLACVTCHSNFVESTHLNNTIEWQFSPTDARVSAATYKGTTGGSETMPVSFPKSYDNCTNLYCHSNAAPAPNSDPVKNVPNEYKTVTWGGSAMTCYSCHKGQASDNTQANCTGTWDTYCATTQDLCAANSGSWDPIQHVCRGVSQGTCTAVSGRWVAVCNPTLTMSSNAHLRLVGPQWIRKYSCVYCHADTVTIDSNGNNIISDKSKHVNAVKDLKIHTTQAAAQGIKNWGIDGVGVPPPSYDTATKVCSNIYCHSDGTMNINYTVVTPAPWNGPSMQCNSCHGHPQGSCSNNGCHDGTTVQTNGKVLATICSNISQDVCWANNGTWNGLFCRGLSYDTCTSAPLGGSVGWPAGQEWMAASPMFPNLGINSGRENSHPGHNQTGFTCSICHYNTVKGGDCATCHSGGIPSGSMGEVAHVDGNYHVNKVKDVVYRDPAYKFYKDGDATHDPKSCTNPCHTMPDGTPMNPRWGGSQSDSYAFCKGCHGSDHDVDYYGNFTNDPAVRPMINLNEWQATGHGRPAMAGNYPSSNNPPANLPGNACWYCHDKDALHTDPSNPFRLKKHDQFRQRYQKECVFCHMQGLDSECLGCHNEAVESLAPQLLNIGPGKTYCKTEWADGSAATSPCVDHTLYADGGTSCLSSSCHYMDPNDPNNWKPDYNNTHNDYKRHNTGAGLWTVDQQKDINNQYVWMGVCLKCHDDDSEGSCSSCHPDYGQPGSKYGLGYDGGQGAGYLKTAVSKASSVHFGYKHYNFFLNSGGWTKDANGNYTGTTKGGKFCWDCHDPHGDGNIYMIHSKVSTSTDGVYGKPKNTADVVFTRKVSGTDYASSSANPAGLCNVCHHTLTDSNNNVLVEAKHYTDQGGDHHNEGRVCTNCHQHRFTDSHSSGVSCTTCHLNKPLPRHSGFSLPRDCTKCHIGIGKRMDIVGQMTGNSHHVQGVTLTNKHCYACHWEATSIGLIDLDYHLGYNYKTHVSVPGAANDLVIWGAGTRPTKYSLTGFCDGSGVGCSTKTDQPSCIAVTNCQWTPPTAATFTALFVGSSSSYVCSIPGITNPTDCASAHICSNWFGGAAVTYSTQADCEASGFTWAAGEWGNERNEIQKVTPHCLGCHSDQNNDTKPFAFCSVPAYLSNGSVVYTKTEADCTAVGGTWNTDCKTPMQYSWDKTSIDARYSQTGTVTWGKYTGYSGTAPKNITKAYSAHGNAVNQGGFDPTTCTGGSVTQTSCTANGGIWNYSLSKCTSLTQTACAAAGGTWSSGNGLDGSITSTRGGSNAKGVQCFDCHSSHGSKLNGNTSSYITTYGSFGVGPYGGNLKEAVASKGGYVMKYTASANSNQSSVNPYGAGAAQCFDCHETPNVVRGSCNPSQYTDQQSCINNGGQWDTKGVPWGYYETFGASTPIMGYKDTSKFGQGVKGSQARYPYRANKNTIVGGHLHASTPDLTKDSGAATAGSNTTLTASKSWTPDAWVNYYVLIMGKCSNDSSPCLVDGDCSSQATCGLGNNGGQMRKITSNNANTITFETLSANVEPGDSFRIVPYAARINGLCTPCHDPHGVSPTIGAANQPYAVPLLKGTWLTSPYKEDAAQTNMGSRGNTATGGYIPLETNPVPFVYTDAKTFGGGRCSNTVKGCTDPTGTTCYSTYLYDFNKVCITDSDCSPWGGTCVRTVGIRENDAQFGGLCLSCHPKTSLTDGVTHTWKDKNRVHESVMGWKTANATIQHNYPCSKCHQPHNSGLPRLMQTDCLDYKHRGRVASGGTVQSDKDYNDCRSLSNLVGHVVGTAACGVSTDRIGVYVYSSGGFPVGFSGIHSYAGSSNTRDLTYYQKNCHPNGTWPDNRWNNKTDW